MGFTAGVDEEVPVLIVGGGGAGLTASGKGVCIGTRPVLVQSKPASAFAWTGYPVRSTEHRFAQGREP